MLVEGGCMDGGSKQPNGNVGQSCEELHVGCAMPTPSHISVAHLEATNVQQVWVAQPEMAPQWHCSVVDQRE